METEKKHVKGDANISTVLCGCSCHGDRPRLFKAAARNFHFSVDKSCIWTGASCQPSASVLTVSQERCFGSGGGEVIGSDDATER